MALNDPLIPGTRFAYLRLRRSFLHWLVNLSGPVLGNIKGVLTDRQKVYDLLTEFTKQEHLLRHALAVEAAMRAYALRFGQDEELWGAVGLIHDFDYELHPSPGEHPRVGCGILRQRGWPEEAVRAVLSHGDNAGLARESLLERTLYAVDELTGFIMAVALVRPSRSLDDLKARSVKKKMKDKAFARAVSREDLVKAAEGLGVGFDEHVDFVIQALRPVQQRLGFQPLEQGA